MDLIEIACKHLRDSPPLLEDARAHRGGPTILGSLLMAMTGHPRRMVEHAVMEAVERIK